MKIRPGRIRLRLALVPGQIVLVLFAASWLLLCALPARAQEKTMADAERLLTQATDLYEQGHVAEAIPFMRQAVEIVRRVMGEDRPDYAVIVEFLGKLLSATGEKAEAERLFRQALAIDEKALGPDHPILAVVLRDLGQLYQDQGRFTDAEPILKRGLAIYEKAPGPDHPDLVQVLIDLALLLDAQGRYAEAVPYAQRGAEIRKRLLGEDHLDYASSLNILATLYLELGRLTESELLYRQALAIREKSLGREDPGLASYLTNLASLGISQGRYAEAEQLCRRALAISEKALGPDHPDVALVLSMLGDASIRLARLDDAEGFIRRSLTIREKALGPDHPDVAYSLIALANLFYKQGRYADAGPLFQRAQAILEKSFGPEHPHVARALHDLAVDYDQQGREAESEPIHQRALALAEKAFGPDHPEVATYLKDLAAFYEGQGRYAEAEPLYRRSLAIREKALGPDHPDVAASLGNLARLYGELGKDMEAAELYKRSLAIRQKALGPDHPDVATTWDNIATLFDKVGRHADAEVLYKRALAILEKALGPEHPDVAVTLNNIAQAAQEQGKYAEAESLYKRSLAINEKVLGPDHPVVTVMLGGLAVVCWGEGKPAEAETYFERAFQNLSKRFAYGFTYMSEKDRLLMLDRVSGYFPTYYSFCLAYHEQIPDLAGKMYDLILRKKGLVAQSAAALRAKIKASGDRDLLESLDRLTAKRSDLAKLASAGAAADPESQGERREEIDRLTKEANELEKDLVTRSAALGDLREEADLAGASWPQVRDALKPSEAAVEIVCFPAHDGRDWMETSTYAALVLRRGARLPELIVLGERRKLEGIPLTDYRRLVEPPERGVRRPEGLGRRFYDAFWRPLEAALGDATKIYVSADGALNQVSLGVVPGRDGRPLMESYDLRPVNSTKDILRSGRPGGRGVAVLVGDPDFALSEAEQRASLRPASTDRGGPGTASLPGATRTEGPSQLRSRNLRGGTLEGLSGTAREIQDVSSLLARRGWQVKAYTGKEALEERVKNVDGPRVLHLATHGFFEADQSATRDSAREDPMLRSGVYLAGANRVLTGSPPAKDLDDGVLTAYEASQLDLQGTELVVLSACDTGLGVTEAGEGVFGLRRGLQVAGADAVLMSLWPVPDEETKELMALFYEKWLGGKEKHDALREAQAELREKVRARSGEDAPFFWGAFILVGR